MLVLLFSVMPFFQWLSGVILVLVTLRKGPKEGALMLVPASAVYVVLAVGHSLPPLWLLGLLGAVAYLWLMGCVLWLFASWQKVLEFSLLLAVTCILVVHAVVPDLVQWWMNLLHEIFVRLQESIRLALIEEPSDQLENFGLLVAGVNQEEVLRELAQVALGILLVLNMATKLVLVGVARWWQATLYNPGGLRVELCAVRLHYIATVMFLACVVASYSGVVICADMLPIFQGIFALAGLSLIHFSANCFQSTWKVWLLLLLVYGLFVTFFEVVLWTVAVVAMVDSVFNVRSLLSSKQKTNLGER